MFPQHAMNKLLLQFGDKNGIPNIYYYGSRLCSCVGERGVYDPACKQCIFGYIYPEVPVEELILRTAVRLNMMNERMYHIFQGGARITIPKKRINGSTLEMYDSVAQGDVVVMKNDKRRDRDICMLGSRDYLFAFHVTEVLAVSEKQTTFTEGTDYEVEYNPAQTKIKWLDGNKPASFYSVEFTSLVNFMVWDDQVKPRGDVDGEYPKMVMCRLRPYSDPNTTELPNIQTDNTLGHGV